jgi:hypothetical protein
VKAPLPAPDPKAGAGESTTTVGGRVNRLSVLVLSFVLDS